VSPLCLWRRRMEVSSDDKQEAGTMRNSDELKHFEIADVIDLTTRR